jgi:outer membrane protein OmpA-like peptidoglycan-associated protein
LIEQHSVYFDLDKDVFVSQEGEELDNFLDNLLYKPLLDVKILGYCDDRGSYEYNLDLSNRRVETVSKHLQQHSIDVSHISKKVEGRGEIALTQMDSSDDTISTERAENRRVDIIFSLAAEKVKQIKIKKLNRENLSEKEKEQIDDYENEVIENFKDSTATIAQVKVGNDDELLEIPTKLDPPVDNETEPFRTLLSKKLKKGQVIRLENILFYKGRSTMLEESEPLLERVAEILLARKDIEFEIHGHVCCINPYYEDAYNRDTRKNHLSKDRARAIYKKLLKRGISKNRMRYEGFGRSKPLGGSDKLDRRVELYITKINPQK